MSRDDDEFDWQTWKRNAPQKKKRAIPERVRAENKRRDEPRTVGFFDMNMRPTATTKRTRKRRDQF